MSRSTAAASVSAAAEKPARGRAAGGRASGLRDNLKRYTRDQLIAAAIDSFAAVGFRGTTVERIVELAGTTAPTFYRHFASKNDLIGPLQAHLSEEVRGVTDRLDRIAAIDFPTMRAWLDEFIAMWERTHRLCAAYWEATELDPAVAADIIPSSLVSIDRLENLIGRCASDQRERFRLRLALTIPLLDRATMASLACADPDLRARLLDEFTGMLVASLREVFEPGEPASR